MPIVHPTSLHPNKAFQNGLLHLVRWRRIPAEVTVYPHVLHVYNLRVPDVLAKADLGKTARHVSTRYFAAGHPAGTMVSGDVDVSSTPRITSLSHGDSVHESLKAVEALKTHPDLNDHHYELRLLRIPGLAIEAFWLKPLLTGHKTDLVVPYHTLFKDLDPARPYPVHDFFEILHPLAKRHQ